MVEKLAVCAVVKNEGRYIREWLDFHYVVGVRRFVIYSNNSTDDTVALVQNWARSELVTLHHWPNIPAQSDAYQHMIDSHRDVAEWCAFIDADEFLCPRTTLSLLEVLDGFGPDIGGLYVHWLMFGSSGLTGYSPQPVTERFLRRAEETFGPNNIGKTIVRLACAKAPRNGHLILCNGRIVNDSGDEIDQGAWGIHTSTSHRLVGLHHYFTKSSGEWIARRQIGKVDRVVGDADFLRPDEEFHRHDVNNVVDETAARITRQAKLVLG